MTKSIYIRPEIEVTKVVHEMHLCSSSPNILGRRYSRFGNPYDDEYGNPNWLNEKKDERGGFSNYPFNVVTIEDDNGNMNSRSKGHSLWDDDDDDW